VASWWMDTTSRFTDAPLATSYPAMPEDRVYS
jgi:hypothetical protein